MVADLVAEAAEHRPERLAELAAQRVAVDGVGLGEVDRDDAVEVAGQTTLAGQVDEVEHEACRRPRPSARRREPQPVELVHEAALARLGERPRGDGVGSAVVGPPAGQAARSAPDRTLRRGQHPVAPPRRVEAAPLLGRQPGDVGS